MATLWFAYRHSMAWQKARRFGYFPLCMYGLLYDWRAIITRMANTWLRFIVLLTSPVHKCAFWHGIVWYYDHFISYHKLAKSSTKSISKQTENFQLTNCCDVDQTDTLERSFLYLVLLFAIVIGDPDSCFEIGLENFC